MGSWANPLIELLLLVSFSISGAALCYLAGLRKAWQLLGLGIGATALLRVLSYIVTDALGQSRLAMPLWIVCSLGVLASAFWLGKLDFARRMGLVALGSGSMALIAIAAKYLLDIGERPHTDSSRIVAIAQLIMRDGEPLRELDEFFKRGFSYPALLGIAPPGRILMTLTPFIFLSLLVLIWGWFREAEPKLKNWQKLALVLLAVAVATVPMIQISVFYLNAHTLLALALAAVAYGVWRHGSPDLEFKRLESIGFYLILGGTALATLTRPEGFVLATLVYLPLLGSLKFEPGWKARAKAVAPIYVAIIGVTCWIYAYDYQNPHRWPIALWLIAFIGLALAAIWLLPWFDQLRRFGVQIFVVLMLGALGVAAVLNTGPIFEGIRAQAKNLLQGFGEWGLLAPATVLLLLVIGWFGLSRRQQVLMQTSAILILGTLATKLVDNGTLGRLGTTDSVNRMWIQLIPIIAITVALGISERFVQTKNSLAAETSNSARDSKTV